MNFTNQNKKGIVFKIGPSPILMVDFAPTTNFKHLPIFVE